MKKFSLKWHQGIKVVTNYGITRLIELTVYALLCLIGATSHAQAEVPELVEGNSTFAFDVYQHLSKEQAGNLFFSPLSISSALAMTYAGSAGDTKLEMKKALKFSLPDKELHQGFLDLSRTLDSIQSKGAIKLNIANAIWPEKSYEFRNKYLQTLKDYYGVEVTPLDYLQHAEPSRSIINSWVEEKTEDKIKDLLPPGVLDTNTKMVLTNAIYFKGNWETQFKAEKTKDQEFTLASGEKKLIPMMHQRNSFPYYDSESLQILELPYQGEDLSMLVLLPKVGKPLTEIERMLDIKEISTLVSKLQKQKLDVYLPKFKVESSLSLSSVLKALGMKDAFDEERADFSSMDGSRELYITEALHKAYIEVNEEGSEAAAATGIVLASRSIRIYPSFKANRPFIFLIRDKRTGSILFLGRLSRP